MELLHRFRDHLRSLALPPGRALVAVSGGPDSVALLDLLHRTRELHRLELLVGHVDHGIHPESSQVARQVVAFAERLGLPCVVEQARLAGGASETRAREARYRLLYAMADRLGIGLLLTAHHADDQVETVLLRFLGGSGPAGLSGMAARSGRLVRPLLPYRRDDLTRYVEARGLTVWHDPSNHDPTHLRSWLRADLLPTLRNRIPDADARLARVGALAGKNRRAWDLVLEQLPGLDSTSDESGISIAANCLRAYDSTLAEAVLMAVARRAGCPLGPVRAGRVLGLLEGESGRLVPLAAGWRAELAFDRLRLLPPPTSEPTRLALQGTEGVGQWGRWHLRWKTEPAPERQPREALTAWFRPEPLQVRAWAPGDRVRPLAGAGRRLVVRCFQDAQVPKSRRGRWPVITGADSVVWVPGVCRSDALLPSAGAEALRVDAQHA